MVAIVFIILQISLATRAVWKIGEYSRIFARFSWGIFGHVTRLDQSRVSENIWWIINIYINLTIHLLPVNHNAPLHLFGPNCNIKFIFNIQPVQPNKSVALSNEALIKSGNKPSFVVPFHLSGTSFLKKNNLLVTLNAIIRFLMTLLENRFER